MKKVVVLILMGLCLSLSGCALAAVWLDSCGYPDADLVVVNESDRDAYSIVLEYESNTETVQAADGTALLAPGQSCGLELKEGEVLVILRDRLQRTIGRGRLIWQEGERLYLTFDGVTEGSLCVEERSNGSGSHPDVEKTEGPAAPEDSAMVSELDPFYQNPVTRPYEDIRTLGEDYSRGQAQMDNCFVIGAMVHNDYLYGAFMERCQEKEDGFIRVVQGIEESGIVIDDILYDSGADKIYLVHDATRKKLIAEADRRITYQEFDGIAEYRYGGHLYWIAFNGEISDIDFNSDEVFVITTIS